VIVRLSVLQRATVTRTMSHSFFLSFSMTVVVCTRMCTRPGYKIQALEKDVVEMKITYDDFKDSANSLCGINDEYNANKNCTLVFEAPEDMRPPILVYYELTNFHQNHRNYFQSRDDFQLLGKVGEQLKVQKEACDPLNKLGNMTINPCGLIANTFFNDYFNLLSGDDANGNLLEMVEKGIAWSSDIEYMYKQPDGFNFSECPVDQCDSTCCEGDDSSCVEPYYDTVEKKCYRYFYPLANETQYLHQTYPDIISPIEGVTNEHFIVWMRVATQPSFRKLYGWINQPIKKGEIMEFNVNANYVVTRFSGTKSLILTTNNIFGGRNPYFGPSFYGLGYFCFAAGIFFALKHLIRPRKLADPTYLQYKED
jgi:hypothetical protein